MSCKTLRVLMNLEFCVGHLIKVFENANSSFISSKGLRLLRLAAPLFVSILNPCYHGNQSKIDSNINGVCNLCYGFDCALNKFRKVTVTLLMLFFLLPSIFLNCSRFNFQGKCMMCRTISATMFEGKTSCETSIFDW